MILDMEPLNTRSSTLIFKGYYYTLPVPVVMFEANYYVKLLKNMSLR